MSTPKYMIWKVCFDYNYRSQVTVSDSGLVDFDPQRSHFHLKLVNDGATGSWYTLTSAEPDMYVKSGTINPGKLVSYVSLEVDALEPTDDDGNADTAIQARVHNGTSQFYWDGAAWAAAGSGDWNSIQEVSDNLASWTGELGLVFNLTTVDKRLTPYLSGFKILYTVDIVSYREDWLYDVVVKQLADGVRPLTDYIVVQDNTGDTSVVLLDGWTITDLDAVWDHTDDPDHASDLLDSFDAVNGVATLISSVPAGHKLFIRARYAPTCAINTSPDYSELGSSPSITISNISVDDRGELGTSEYVMDKYTTPPTAVILPAPRRQNINMDIELNAALGIDMERLTEAMGEFINNHQVLTSAATGQQATFRMTSDLETDNAPNFSEERASRMSVVLENIHVWHKPAVLAGDPSYPGVGYGVRQGGVTVTAQVGNATEDTTI